MKGKLFICFLFFVFELQAQQKEFRVGLTLSGGGAKGLAHIGVLQAIDSAGLKVDYLTGTSMGSIMGALYAVGYSGNRIEELAREMNWGKLFSGTPDLSTVNIAEKDEFESYAVEVPFEKGKVKIGTGLIEAQEIWVKFQELFLPVYNVKDFDNFSIPFKCIATDAATGKPVVLDTGEVVTAIRASMAIPSIFTAIDYKDTKLIDGGVVRNFPVRDAVNMGADYAIGVNVSQPLSSADKLTSAIDILYQIGFYKDADDFAEEIKLCDMIIEPDVKEYGAGSFANAEEIIAIGKKIGNLFYPKLKHLADSLKALDPGYTFERNRLPVVKGIIVDTISVSGLNQTSKRSFMHLLDIHAGDTCSAKDVAEGIRKVFGTKNYNRINYFWEPAANGHAHLKLNVIENPLTYAKVALHYNSFSKIALIAAMESKNLFWDRSRTLVKLNLSENYRVLFRQSQSFGPRDNNDLIFSGYLESFKYPVYIDFRQTYVYRNLFYEFDLRAQHTFNQRSVLGTGTSWQSFHLDPKVFGTVSVEGENDYLHSYIFYKRNTLDDKIFPTRGLKMHVEAGYIYRQRPNDLFLQASELTATIDTLDFDGYGRFDLNVEHYIKLNSKLTLMDAFNAGANLNEENSYLNFYYVGGLNHFLRNQITFAGLNEYEVYTNSLAAALLGVQYNPFKNVYATLKANVGIYNFVDVDPDSWNGDDNFLSGYAATISYASGLGPIQFSLLYCDQSKTFSGHINLGYHF